MRYENRSNEQTEQPTVDTSHNRIDLSSDPEAKVLESGLQAMVEMPAKWPSKVWRCLPEEVSHILIVVSAADRRRRQFDLKIFYSVMRLTAAGDE